MVFKVDSNKTYDSMSWDYLEQIMGFLDFGRI